MKRLIALVNFLAIGLCLLQASGSPAQSPAFEAASIRLDTDLPVMSIGPGLSNSRLNAGKVTLKRLLSVAYGITEPCVIGPDWLDRNRFDILAKSPPGVPDSQLKPMLQTLLKDRFNLTAHLETRVMPVYYVVLAKGGVKMPIYPAPDRGPGRPGDNPNMRGYPMMRGTATASGLAGNMAFVVGRTVIDKTGLKDRYNYFLSFAPLSPQTGDSVPEFGPLDFFTAIQKQLGLKLEPGKDNVKVVVVDHMERMPTEN